eukprot:12982012-Alexandrium_andersonii.AAC.1
MAGTSPIAARPTWALPRRSAASVASRSRLWVAGVARPLLSGSALARAGNDAFFASSGGRVVDREAKRVIGFTRVGG